MKLITLPRDANKLINKIKYENAKWIYMEQQNGT